MGGVMSDSMYYFWFSRRSSAVKFSCKIWSVLNNKMFLNLNITQLVRLRYLARC